MQAGFLTNWKKANAGAARDRYRKGGDPGAQMPVTKSMSLAGCVGIAASAIKKFAAFAELILKECDCVCFRQSEPDQCHGQSTIWAQMALVAINIK
jgi:hypothetical protein